MRKVKAKLRRTLRKAFVTAALVAALATINLISIIPMHLYYWFGAVVFIGFCFWIAFKFKYGPEKYINERGYVVLVRENDLEHRYIAKQMLGRDLDKNEVVHHINGNKTDNEVRNLCLMDGEKHEHFHTWLRWKKEKTARYPSIREQKRVLVDEYGGTLLESLISLKNARFNEQLEVVSSELQMHLFNELRKERKRIASEKKVPAYMVFNDKTLMEMSKTMPESESAMLRIQGVGSYKFRLYGPFFIAVVKKFKNDFDLHQSGRKILRKGIQSRG